MATLPNPLQTKTAPQPQAEATPKLWVFKGEFGTYANFITPKGEAVAFYKGYTSTQDAEVAKFISTIKGVEEVKVTPDLKLPTPPERKRSRNWAASSNPKEFQAQTRISHMELLQRAVANSSHTPQAADSTSTAQ